MLVFFSCSTSKFWVVSFRVGIPIWAVAGHHPLGGFSRGFIKEWSNLDLLDPLGWGEEGPWIHMFRTRFHTQKKNSFKMFKFQDPICSSRKRRIHVFFWGGSGVSSMSSRTVGAQSGPLRFGGGPSQKMVLEAWSPWFADPILLLNQGFCCLVWRCLIVTLVERCGKTWNLGKGFRWWGHWDHPSTVAMMFARSSPGMIHPSGSQVDSYGFVVLVKRF